MLDIQPAILRVYQAALGHDNVPGDQKPHFVRWLRYYLDFCHKYNHDPEVVGSFRPFEDKLIEKRQEDWKRLQAYQAIVLYQRWTATPFRSSTDPITFDGCGITLSFAAGTTLMPRLPRASARSTKS